MPNFNLLHYCELHYISPSVIMIISKSVFDADLLVTTFVLLFCHDLAYLGPLLLTGLPIFS